MCSPNTDLPTRPSAPEAAATSRASWLRYSWRTEVLGRALSLAIRAAWVLLVGISVRSVPAATFELVAGTGEAGSDGDGGPAQQARLNQPFGLVRGPDGALWFADYGAHVIRRIDATGIITTVVGNGRPAFTGDGSPAREASLHHPHELRFDAGGNLFIADTSNHAIRRWDARSGILTTWAGVGRAGYSGDGGPATNAELRDPISLQFGPNGDLFVVEVGNHVLRRIDVRTRTISTFAGTGKPGPTPDGAPLSGTPLQGPRSLDFDPVGQLWLATREGNQVLRLDLRASTIHHVAGTGRKGYGGDGGLALTATFSGPKGIAVAPDGAVLLADTENHVIRRLDPRRGTVERVAGIGPASDSRVAASITADDPLQVRLARPHGVFVDAGGTVFVGDSENHRIIALRGIGRSGSP